jgi:hypothetical protein
MSKRILPLSPDRQLQAYVIGLAIGDGNLSNPNGRAVRLRITCDAKYSALIAKIVSALRNLLPRNRVSLIGSSGNFVNVSVYSNHLEALLGWKASGGSKHRQCVEVPAWICEDRSLSVPSRSDESVPQIPGSSEQGRPLLPGLGESPKSVAALPVALSRTRPRGYPCNIRGCGARTSHLTFPKS